MKPLESQDSGMTVKRMQVLYKELTPDPYALPVFCVGNAAYKKHQAGFQTDDSEAPNLSVEATNIPALRHHSWLAPTEAKVNETKHMVSIQLPALIVCFEMYVNRTHMGRKGEIRKTVMEPQSSCSKFVDDLGEALDARAEKTILEAFPQ
ncbi:hypothetical protein LTR62_007697 [Meristemomyces frigidus]|uniref:Uncharacterized protein n=1 Tax=Meristemomyces frigidus TaxID=1508187 RepID=A0AAN7TAS0_9PEZI|nr:hypothetical protein LTR62_007697 [Meristemomyces frigidus]